MPIKNWSTTAASNNSASPNGFPEGMAPSGVNDAARQVMADVRTQWNDAQWFDYGDSGLSRASATSFKISTDVTARYEAGRRVKLYDVTTLYGVIASSSYSAPDTTVNVTMDSGSLTTSLTSVALAILTPSNKSIPNYNLDTLTVSGVALLHSTLTVSGAATFNSTVTISGAATFNSTVTISGAAVLQSTLNVQGATTLSGNAVAKGTFLVEGAQTVSGAATFNSTVTISGAAVFLSTITPSQTSGIVGTTTNNNANAGSVGEMISSVIANASGVSLTNATPANVTSISLTAGDWDVWGNVEILGTGQNISEIIAWTSSTSATVPDSSLYNRINMGANGGGNNFTQEIGTSAPFQRFSLASTTTVYLSAQVGSNGGTNKASGGIYARRAR